jgi:hypothetical protein
VVVRTISYHVVLPSDQNSIVCGRHDAKPRVAGL